MKQGTIIYFNGNENPLANGKRFRNIAAGKVEYDDGDIVWWAHNWSITPDMTRLTTRTRKADKKFATEAQLRSYVERYGFAWESIIVGDSKTVVQHTDK